MRRTNDRRRDKRWTAGAALSLLVHAGLLLVLYLAPRSPIRAPVPMDEPPPMVVALLPPPDPEPPGGSAGPPAPVPAPAPPKPEPPKPKPEVKAPPKPRVALHAPKVTPPPAVKVLVADPEPVDPGPDPASIVSASELASATTAGGGGSGGAGSGSGTGTGDGAGSHCDMVRRIQAALRADAKLRAAAFSAQSTSTDPRAIRIWNGDWIRGQGQEGKGLAGLRQAIMVEVGFAPEACRNQPVRGLVLITFGDGPGAPRIALGQGAWKWTDLLGRSHIAGRS
jgi:hypothetical protein